MLHHPSNFTPPPRKYVLISSREVLPQARGSIRGRQPIFIQPFAKARRRVEGAHCNYPTLMPKKAPKGAS